MDNNLLLKNENLLAQEQNKSIQLEQELVKQKLASKDRLLEVTNTSLFQQKNHTEELFNTLKQLKPYTNPEGKRIIQQVFAQINSYSIDSNWLTFERTFTSIYPNFFTSITNLEISFTNGEKRMCAFIKMELTTSAITSITLQTTESVYTQKRRLRKKLGQKETKDLELYLQSLD